jgi:hypothetical protein
MIGDAGRQIVALLGRELGPMTAVTGRWLEVVTGNNVRSGDGRLSRLRRRGTNAVVGIGVALGFLAGFGHNVQDVWRWVVPAESALPPSDVRVVPSSELHSEPGCGGTCLYNGENVIDGRSFTAWAEGARGTPTDQYLVFSFTHPVKIGRIRIAPGWQRDGCTFRRNARPSMATISGDGLSPHTYPLRDELGFTSMKLPAAKSVSSLKVAFSGVVPGSVCGGRPPADDMLVSEVAFYVRSGTIWRR